MLKHTLSTGKIQGEFTNIVILPFEHSDYEYLINWNDKRFGVVLKIDNKWYGETKELRGVIDEIGAVIDRNF